MNTLPFLLMTMFCSIVSFAGESSEIFHQTEANVWEASADLTYQSKKDDDLGYFEKFPVVGDIRSNSLAAIIKAEYGVLHSLSFGLALPYAWKTTNANSKTATATSVGDPEIFSKLRFDNVGPGSLRFQLAYSRTLGYQSSDKVYSGASSITPSVGYEVAMEKHLFGVRFDYSTVLGYRVVSVVDDGDDYEIRGGDTFSSRIFYEYDSGPITYGLMASVINRAVTTVTFNSPYAYNNWIASGGPISPRSAPYTPSQTNLELEAYFPIAAAENLKVIPHVTYMTQTWSIGATARMNF